MWSPVEKTALAEAEIEYHDHTSTTIWVRFPVIQAPLPELQGAAVVIWTTTPWTMPGNRAVAAGEDIDYALLHVDTLADGSRARIGEKLLVALDLLPQFCKETGIATHHVLHVFKGDALAGMVCAHPLRGRGFDHDVPLLLGDFVTTEAGTGFVHIAPGHGEEDFDLGRRHGLEIPETVDGDGTFNRRVPLFAGVHVYKAADPVCAALDEAGTLLARGKLVHSYPHSWRSKAPLIFRATPQWFIRLDGPERIREKALAAIDATLFVPDQGRNRIGSMVAGRPDWCISRQRAWGVPITVFVDKQHRRAAARSRGGAAHRRGVHRGGRRCLVRVAAVALPRQRPQSGRLRASDGHRGRVVRVRLDPCVRAGGARSCPGRPICTWKAPTSIAAGFSRRCWKRSARAGAAPFKAVLTDGFVLDEHGRKMSKSLGNVVAPEQVAKQYGIDILRLWVMMSDTSEDLRIGAEILKQTAELYRRLRNTLRWVLGSLAGFGDAESVPVAEMPELERWVLHRLSMLDARIRGAVASYDWIGVYPELHNFCAADLSAFYFDVRKDALYCDRPDSLRRRAARTVLDHLHRCLTTWLAPVLCFTAEEAWGARFGDGESVHLQVFPPLPQEWRDDVVAAKWERIRDIRRSITAELEVKRKGGEIGSSLQAAVALPLTASDAKLLTPAEWTEISIVSKLTIEPAAAGTPEETPEQCAVRVCPAPGTKCVRCWRVLEEVGQQPGHRMLCARCADAVESR